MRRVTALHLALLCLASAALTLAGCGRQGGQARFVRAVPWAETGVWLKADTHVHTKFSDGAHPLREVVEEALARGCDVLAITDHLDPDRRGTSDELFAELSALRQQHPRLILLAGGEWNLPPHQGREHALVLLPPTSREQKTLREFQARFDDYGRTGEPASALAALRWLHEQAASPAEAPVVFYNHPHRKRRQLGEFASELALWHRQQPHVMVGFEGGPGHQNASIPGHYDGALPTVDRWDPAMEPGATWDQLLSMGLPVWGALATSDLHEAATRGRSDFWPGEFSETWIYSPGRSGEGVVAALRAGTFFGVHGQIARQVRLEVVADGLHRPAIAGEAIRVRAGTPLLVALRLEVPSVDWQGQPNRIDELELIAITASGARSVVRQPPALAATPLHAVVPASPGGMMLRARGRRIVPEGPDLLFYTNPVQVLTEGEEVEERGRSKPVVAAAPASGTAASDPPPPRPPMPAAVSLGLVLGASVLVALSDRWRLEAVRRFSRKVHHRPPSHTRPHTFRRHFAVALAGFVLLAWYGSLVPLQWVPMSREQALRALAAMLARPLSFESRTDWATNVLLFVPIGYFAAGCLSGRATSDRRRLLLLPLVVAAATVLSVLIETSQMWTASRTPSQNDIVAQSVGSLLGGTAWLISGRWLIAWLEHWRTAQRPRQKLERLLEMYLLVTWVYMLLPLDLTLRPAELYHKWRDGRICLVPLADSRGGLGGWLDLVGDMLVLAPLGALAAVWRWPQRDGVRPLGAAVLLGGGLALAIEASQVLVVSRVASVTDVLAAVAGVVLGWGLALLVVRQKESGRTAGKRWLGWGLGLACAAYAALLAAFLCLPYERVAAMDEVAQRWGEMWRRPLLTALYHGTELNAVSQIWRKTLLFLVLGALAGLTNHLRRPGGLSPRAGMMLAWLVTALVAVAVELAQLALPPHIPDLTDMLLGVAGASLGLLAVAWLARESLAPQTLGMGSGRAATEAAAGARQTPPG
jgi:VanZ family protein